MTGADRAALVGFVASLSAHDLLFVPRDLGHPKVIDAWMRSLDAGELVEPGRPRGRQRWSAAPRSSSTS